MDIRGRGDTGRSASELVGGASDVAGDPRPEEPVREAAIAAAAALEVISSQRAINDQEHVNTYLNSVPSISGDTVTVSFEVMMADCHQRRDSRGLPRTWQGQQAYQMTRAAPYPSKVVWEVVGRRSCGRHLAQR
jgi:hypothetical protein